LGEVRSLIVRHWPWRLLLLLLLLPLAFTAFKLARLPGLISFGIVLDGGEHVLTATNRPGNKADCRVLSLRTGQTDEFRLEDLQNYSGQQLLWTERDATERIISKQLDLKTFRKTELGRIDGEATSGYFASPEAGVIATVSKQNELVVIDLRNKHRASISLPPLPQSKTNSWAPVRSLSPSRLVVGEYSSAAAKGPLRMLLFSYENGKLTQLAQWPSVRNYCTVSDSILSLTANSVLETRRLSDGALVDAQPLGKIVKAAPGGNIVLEESKFGLIPLRVTPSRLIIYDYVRRQIIVERFMPLGYCMDLREDAAVFSDRHSVEVVRLSDQQTLQRFDFPQRVESAKLVADRKQLTVLLDDESIQRYDLTTGKLLRTWRSRAWVFPTVMAMLVGFAVWSWLWACLGLWSGWSPLVDVVTVHGLVMAGLLSPALWLGSPLVPRPFAILDVESLAACWLLLLSLWCVFGNSRWSLRLLGPILGVAAILGLNLILLGVETGSIVLAAVGVVGVAVLFMVLLGLARHFGLRWINENETKYLASDPARTGQIPLRDSFWLMATIAIFFAVARFVPLKLLDARSLTALLLMIATFSIAALGGTWSAMGPRTWWARFACLLVLVGGISIFHPPLFRTSLTWAGWFNGLRPFLLLAIFSFGSLLVFRVRGWRLVMSSFARQQAAHDAWKRQSHKIPR
jgi:hypothetical protein